jgi:hypothetical protein
LASPTGWTVSEAIMGRKARMITAAPASICLEAIEIVEHKY